MKKYRQLVTELPAKKVVFAFGRFQPPTNGHALLVNAVAKLAKVQKADHIIYASGTQDKKSNPLPVGRKVYYLKRMFPGVNFLPANEEVNTFISVAANLSKRYKHLVMVAGSDRVAEFKKILDNYNGNLFNFETIEVVSAGERDPDSDTVTGMSGTKMRDAAKKGDFNTFKRGLPKVLTELDAKRLMNEVRQGMGLESIKETVNFERDEIREKYHAGEIFNVGDKVTFEEQVCEIVKRGSNHVLIQLENGMLESKWLNQIQVYEDITKGDIHNKELNFGGYTTKNFHHSEDAIKSFVDTIGRNQHAPTIVNALKATDAYMGLNDKAISGKKLNDQEKAEWLKQHEIAREQLNKIGEFAHHEDYWHNHQHEIEGTYSTYAQDAAAMEEETMHYTTEEKLQVAKVIASALGHIDECATNPELVVNTALRKSKNKTYSEEGKNIIKGMLDQAKEVGIKYDDKLTPGYNVVGASYDGPGNENPTLRKMKIKHQLGEELEEQEESDEDIDKMSNDWDIDDLLETYDDEELAIVDEETGEEVDNLSEDTLNEVLSRQERIKSKIRFAHTQSKRERKLEIALKSRSGSKKINLRARRLAVNILKKRLAKKPLNQLSTSEKERIERVIEKKKKTIDRLALKMVPKVRKTESDRLTHRNYTK